MSVKHPALVWGAVVVGVALIALAVLYWVEPASSLPSFIPGHEAGSSHHHVKHGIASFFVGVALLIYAWFQTGSDKKKELPAS
jgi:O-antigen/teichoic acid export membrane protein